MTLPFLFCLVENCRSIWNMKILQAETDLQ